MATTPRGFAQARLQRLAEQLRAEVDSGAIPGAVTLIVHDGRLACFEAFGWRNAAERRRMTPDCIFRIASMTKPLTVAAALQLVERGEIALGDPVERHLPALANLGVGREVADPRSGEPRLEIEPARRPITVHDLMRHTAGFTYGTTGDSLVQRAYRRSNLIDDQQSNAQLVVKLAELPLAHQPGTTFEYGLSTDVLGHLVEVVSGLTLERYFAEHLTGPLGMTDTSFGLRNGAAERLAEPQAGTGAGETSAIPRFDPGRPVLWHSGGGGLMSTAADYARFCRMLLNFGEVDGVRVLARKSIEWMTADHLPAGLAYGAHTRDLGLAAPLPELGQSYGLGVGVRTAAGLSPVPGSPGDFYWGGATGPYFWVDPRERLICILMLNEPDAARRARYRALLRALVYQALD
ncbi:MAG: beta-lactamase family protein [Gammaproteobacteria bacterium]|nr:beta-lactamase family protein [Gammaproteobacteria bacterium]